MSFNSQIIPAIDRDNWQECVEASRLPEAFVVVPPCRSCPGVYHLYHGSLPQKTIEDARLMAEEFRYRDYRIAKWPSGEWVEEEQL